MLEWSESVGSEVSAQPWGLRHLDRERRRRVERSSKAIQEMGIAELQAKREETRHTAMKTW